MRLPADAGFSGAAGIKAANPNTLKKSLLPIMAPLRTVMYAGYHPISPHPPSRVPGLIFFLHLPDFLSDSIAKPNWFHDLCMGAMLEDLHKDLRLVRDGNRQLDFSRIEISCGLILMPELFPDPAGSIGGKSDGDIEPLAVLEDTERLIETGTPSG